MAASTRDPDYIETSGGVVYSIGSYRNTPLNAFEVTNAVRAPLKALGWTRMNRYGVAQNGEWAHDLDHPLGDGVIFSYLPFEITVQELASQIQRCDPRLSSEWLALCHYWLHYDAERPFTEFALSITEYPLVPLFQSLKPGFARADFEQTISDWIARNAGLNQQGENRSAIDSRDFRNAVKIHRKVILDAAFDGYSEAGALLTRIPESDRDEIEKKAIQTALQVGNTDAAAVESCNRLFVDLNERRDVDLDKVKIPDHVFAKNFYGFIRFGQCERGLLPCRARDSALESFSYSAKLGNPFAEAMQGWTLVNMATQKRRKIFDGPNWDRDRDVGIKLLEKAAEQSVLAKYVLADLYYDNRIGVVRNIDLAKEYLLFAADKNFGNASKMYVERF
ncbi:MAG: hypothetical protein P1V20_28030 [Verrucomicrobiales bacterium]|nr:hypothetical protein [Verrucomicrobiales bacterium]